MSPIFFFQFTKCSLGLEGQNSSADQPHNKVSHSIIWTLRGVHSVRPPRPIHRAIKAQTSRKHKVWWCSIRITCTYSQIPHRETFGNTTLPGTSKHHLLSTNRILWQIRCSTSPSNTATIDSRFI